MVRTNRNNLFQRLGDTYLATGTQRTLCIFFGYNTLSVYSVGLTLNGRRAVRAHTYTHTHTHVHTHIHIHTHTHIYTHTHTTYAHTHTHTQTLDDPRVAARVIGKSLGRRGNAGGDVPGGADRPLYMCMMGNLLRQKKLHKSS
jgi:hypothetical protein